MKKLLALIFFLLATPAWSETVCSATVSTCGGGGGASTSGDNVWTGTNWYDSAAGGANAIGLGIDTGCITFEGATSDGFEITLCANDPSFDSALTIGGSPDGNPWIGSGVGAAAGATETDNVFIGMNAGNAANGTSTDNTCIGDGACLLLSTGDDATCIGADACGALTGGTKNTAIGSDAGKTLATGASNTFVGDTADMGASNLSNTVGIGYAVVVEASEGIAIGSSAQSADSVSIGYQAGDAQAGTDVDNVLIGNQAGTALASGSTDNTIVGDGAGAALTGASSDNNVIIGADAGSADATFQEATLVGFAAGDSADLGQDATLIGNNADITAAGASDATAIGSDATVHWNQGTAVGSEAESADGVSIGFRAGDAQAAADVDNVFIGNGAGGAANGTSTDNTAVGDVSGATLTTGDRNTLYGANTDVGAATHSDVTVIGESMISAASDSILIGFGGQAYMYVHGAGKSLTDNTATDIVTISVADDTTVGAIIEYTVYAAHADEYQVISGSVYLAAENDSGTESCDVQQDTDEAEAGGGGLTLTHACTTGLTDIVRWNLTADSDMGAPATTVHVYWAIRILGPATTITPL